MILYYETDILMIGGTISIKKKKRSYGLFTDYFAELALQDMHLPVIKREYKSGYGEIIALDYSAEESRESINSIKERIDTHFDICRSLDAYYLNMNNTRRQGTVLRFVRYTIPAELIGIVFAYKYIFVSNKPLYFAAALLCLAVTLCLDRIKIRRVRNCIVNQEFMDYLRKYGRRFVLKNGCAGEWYYYHPVFRLLDKKRNFK